MFLTNFKRKTDEELMALIQRGEERAFTELYQRFHKKIIRYFYRMLWRDEHKAQDFLHDLFLKIIEKPEHYHASKKFSTWIYSVAHNMCKNEYRKQNFRQAANEQLVVTEAIDLHVHAKLDYQALSDEVEKLLAKGDEDDRNLFVLRCELEMTFAEIAAILDCPEGTVKSRWFYVKKKLANELRIYHPALK